MASVALPTRRAREQSVRPRAAGRRGGKAALSDRRRPAAAAGALEGLRVLVVEDHADSREALRQFLEAMGARVLLAGDGEEAFRVLAATTPTSSCATCSCP
jgi:PleD family two-component response regulator